jgi:hypothetical protein
MPGDGIGQVVLRFFVCAKEFPAQATFTVFLANDTMTVPLVDFQTDDQGKADALAFTTFFDGFNRIIVVPQDQQARQVQ